MSAITPRKRARHEEEAKETTVKVEVAPETVRDELEGLARDEEFWYDDGSIVLVASSIAFKVYKGPLVDHSPIFRDMLSLPQPAAPPLPSSNVSPPIIRLPDSAVDLRHLLRVLMPSKQIQ